MGYFLHIFGAVGFINNTATSLQRETGKIKVTLSLSVNMLIIANTCQMGPKGAKSSIFANNITIILQAKRQ